MITIEDLWGQIDAHTRPLAGETLAIGEAAGRVALAAVQSATDLPAFDHSAVDGWAFGDGEPGRHRIVGSLPAGNAPSFSLSSGEAARIFTGAPVPEGTFAVAMQEDCPRTGDRVSPPEGRCSEAGEGIRRQAGILAAGDAILEAGVTITPGTVALLAACKISKVTVFRRPAVTHIVTGSELLVPDASGVSSSQSGKIPDTNGPMIAALLGQRGISHLSCCQLGDDSGALQSAVNAFVGDLLLLSGGAGPGEHDHARTTLEKAGFHVCSDRVNSRPGKPLLFATRGAQIAFGLPGNPLSHWVCFQAFVRRALDRLEGREPSAFCETFCRGWKPDLADGRRVWTPARVRIRAGLAEATPLAWLHSGDPTPLPMANALLLDTPDPATQRVKTLLV